MLDIGKCLEFVHIELSAVKTLFYIFGIPVGIGKQLLELDEAILLALALVQNFTAAENAFGAVLSGHIFPLLEDLGF